MVEHIQTFLAPLNNPRCFVRYGMSGDSGFNQAARDAETVTLTVHYAGTVVQIAAAKNQAILAALEQAKLTPAVH